MVEWQRLEDRVAAVAQALGLTVRRQVAVGRRKWGSRRHIDAVVQDARGRRLGIECKFQRSRGTAQEKMPGLLDDMTAWPFDGLLVFDGPGITPDMRGYLLASGRAVEFKHLSEWLSEFFGL